MGQREKAVAFFEQWCCHDVDEQPLKSFNCTLEEVCGEDPDYHAAFQDPDYILWEGRSCSKVLNEERGWVCRDKHQRLPQYQDEHDGGVEYFKKQCCKEKF